MGYARTTSWRRGRSLGMPSRATGLRLPAIATGELCAELNVAASAVRQHDAKQGPARETTT